MDAYTIDPKYQKSAANPDSKFELFSDRHKRIFFKYNYTAALTL